MRLTVHTVDGGPGPVPVAGVIDAQQFDLSAALPEFARPDMLSIADDLELVTSAPVQTGNAHYADGVMPNLSVHGVPLVVYWPN